MYTAVGVLFEWNICLLCHTTGTIAGINYCYEADFTVYYSNWLKDAPELHWLNLLFEAFLTLRATTQYITKSKATQDIYSKKYWTLT